MKIKQITALLLSVLLILTLFSGCGHKHSWTEATCTEPKTCSECGETEGMRLGHEYSEATCEKPETCSRCGKTKGEALEHNMSEATCTEPAKCLLCGYTEGEVKDHVWGEGNCANPAQCTLCGAVSSETYDHDFAPANYQNGSVCRICGTETGNPLVGAFEQAGIVPDIVSEEIFEYVTTTYQSTDIQTSALAKYRYLDCTNNLGDLKTFAAKVKEEFNFSYDFGAMLKEGYVWQLGIGVLCFGDQNYLNYGCQWSIVHEDYFDPGARDNSEKLVSQNNCTETTYTVNFNGDDYTDCRYLYIHFEDKETDSYYWYFLTCFMVPEGYDGTVFGLVYPQDWGNNNITGINLENAHFYRFPAACIE